MHLCLFEDDRIGHLSPLTLTRAVYDLRIGMRSIAERWIDAFPGVQTLLHTRAAVGPATGQEHDRLVNRIPSSLDVLFVNGRWFVETGDALDAVKAVVSTRDATIFVQGDACVAAWVPSTRTDVLEPDALTAESFPRGATIEVSGARLISRLWHPLDLLTEALTSDFSDRTSRYNIYERPGAVISDGAVLAGSERVFVAPGATIRPGAILNAEDGPVYVDREAIVMEQAVVRGPAYVGPHAQVKMGGSVESVSVGPWCKVGGEVVKSILHSYSNKPHAGFLGHSYLGRWCNLGAGTNNSNLKNDYGGVSLYDPVSGDFAATDQQFLGLFMGDHSKSGINAMFNTGTVVGVFCNLYGTGFMPRYIPSFSWGTPESFSEYRLEKALRVAESVMGRRGVPLTDTDRALLTRVYEDARKGHDPRASS